MTPTPKDVHDTLATALRRSEARNARLTSDRDRWRRYARKWEDKYKDEFAGHYVEPVDMFVPVTTQRELDQIINTRLHQHRDNNN
jgi:hypothetical protein